ncbi:MAG TPA: hypothetical protein VGL22_20980 [Terracidiphilus sp.]|jgi:hypothetical protein
MPHLSVSSNLAFLVSVPLSFHESALLALIGGVASLLLAVVSGLIAYFTARANFKREKQRIYEQIDAQKLAEQREQIKALKQKYLAPLRYYTDMLSGRLDELGDKLNSPEQGKVLGWFTLLKDHVARDHTRPDFAVWACYEGVFSVSTIYYTCCYFQCARGFMAQAPFREIVPSFSVELEKHLVSAGRAFVWDRGEKGIWLPVQEVIGDTFTTAQGSRMTYAELCRDLDSEDAFRRAPYLRPLDVYMREMNPQNAASIGAVLKELVHFLDTQAPQAGGKLGALFEQGN